MVGITIRLPASTLDAARGIARKDGVKVTALLRQWIEQNVAEGADDERLVSVGDLKSFIAQKSRATGRGSKTTSRSATSGKWVSKSGSTRARTPSTSAMETTEVPNAIAEAMTTPMTESPSSHRRDGFTLRPVPRTLESS